MIATSVATWLKVGYLGDVLKRMSASFAEAEAAAPSILFIDEIDGMENVAAQANGIRIGDSINRALELLNGAAKTSGVIVVAPPTILMRLIVPCCVPEGLRRTSSFHGGADRHHPPSLEGRS